MSFANIKKDPSSPGFAYPGRWGRGIEYAVRNALPEGWKLEALQVAASFASDDFVAIVRQGAECAQRITIPRRVLWALEAQSVIDTIVDAIDAALGLGRYATTPIVPVEPEWSPYP
ncbi:MAG: hypothetical protein HOV80_36160 [Polyangiaceae bacterium]|nr:hypothetical protein [Polyangiaceae bacterium]